MNAELRARLLIVDDEAQQMKALCDTLEREGYRTTGYTSAKRALDALRPSEFDLLLTDLMMPEMDGIALLKAATEIDPDIVAILMTGHGTIDSAVNAMRSGALDYILKPFKLSTVLPVIERALEIRRLRVENAALVRRERAYIAELEAANGDLEAFSWTVSHDLRAPLRTVSGFCEMFLEDYGQHVPPEGRALLDRVVSGAVRMDRMIEDLLRFSRCSRQPLVKRPVDLEQIVQKVLSELQAENAGRPIELRIGKLPRCDADAALLELALTNLLSNAFKFTRNRSPAVIELGTTDAESEDEVVLFVRDNGAGFDMRYASKLFGVFQRLHSQSEFEGTGVGLSIVRRIVERHGGRIWAESEPEKGACFFLTLPLPEDGAAG
jgi:two-component system sensor histidine kinase/response regulator